MTRFSLQDPDLFRRQVYLGGQWCDADNGATLEVNNPATGEILGPRSTPSQPKSKSPELEVMRPWLVNHV